MTCTFERLGKKKNDAVKLEANDEEVGYVTMSSVIGNYHYSTIENVLTKRSSRFNVHTFTYPL